MRALLVTHSYPPFGHGGVERVTEQAAASLTAAGHEVTILMRRATGAPALPAAQRLVIDGLEVVMVVGGGSARIGRFPGFQTRLDEIFERLLVELSPDVVVISHLITHSPTYVSVAHRWGIPVVLELHDFYAACERAHLERVSGELCSGPHGGQACATHCFPERDGGGARWALRTHLFRRAVTEADALIAPSEFVREYFLRTCGADLPCHVIPNGISVTGPAPSARRGPGEPLHLATVGAVTPHKGTHVVLDALRKARLPAARYTLLGMITQPYFRELRADADRVAGLEFKAYGPYDPVLLPMLLADVDVAIVPSIVWESFSIVAREAMACGVPVIASRLGALPEAIRDGDNGLLFAPGHSAELAALLQKLNADRIHIDRLRDGIRETDWISVDERNQRLASLLESVVAGGVRRPVAVTEHAELAAARDLLTR